MPSSNPENERTVLISPEAKAESFSGLRAAVRVVSGSSQGGSTGSSSQVAHRLRNVSLVLGLGSLLSTLLMLWQPSPEVTEWHRWHHQLMFANTVLLLLIAWRLCVKCEHVLNHLRLTELAIFGPMAVVFLALSVATQLEVAGRGFLSNPAPPWILLIFMYALYIPNSWQRAAAILGQVMILSLFALWLPVWISPEVRHLMEVEPIYWEMQVRESFLLPFCMVAAVWGVRSMGQLRKQAYEARQLGQYRLKKLLGRGGMGEVHLAEHVLLRRPCAIKLIVPEKAGDPQALVRFEREVRLTAQLSHWNTIEIFDYGRTDEGVFYYVMEYLPGLNLQQIVEQQGRLPPERVVHLLRQACDALGEAHASGLIHRDIKPANIFAATRGGVYDVVKLLDFGLVRDREAASHDLSVTMNGVITGSPLYMSPEQAQGDQVDSRSDIYALGIVGYYLLTGHVPFDGEQPMKVLLAHLNSPVPPLNTWGAVVPADLERVILKCLEKSPDDRYQTVGELQSALNRCETANLWTREKARLWWSYHSCPEKKALDNEVLGASCHRELISSL
ncbi:MAG: serine/threonine protein kinase [Planctomycetaceae bacterium]|nr:serine/threonine protein kinase [Planctomycetaceae bacterium]